MNLNVIVGIATIIILYTIANRFGLVGGLIKSKSEKEKEKAENEVKKEIFEDFKEMANVDKNLRAFKGFDKSYFKGAKSWNQLITPESKVLEIENDFYTSLNGWWGDNEAMIYSLLNNEVKNKYQLSQVSDAYYNMHNEDLVERLISDLDDSEKVIVWNIIKYYE